MTGTLTSDYNMRGVSWWSFIGKDVQTTDKSTKCEVI